MGSFGTLPTGPDLLPEAPSRATGGRFNRFGHLLHGSVSCTPSISGLQQTDIPNLLAPVFSAIERFLGVQHWAGPEEFLEPLGGHRRAALLFKRRGEGRALRPAPRRARTSARAPPGSAARTWRGCRCRQRRGGDRCSG